MNPFLIHNYVSPEYFCDRELETEILVNNIKNNSNTAFFAQRRIGKTALIQHVFHHLNLEKEYITIYIDIYSTQNLKAFTNQLANSIYQLFPENKSLAKKFWNSIKLLRPIVSVDTVSGNPELTLDITSEKQFEKSIPQIFQFLESQELKIVVAIDEFQQILYYPEKNIEAILRTAIQPLKNVNFIFCGSNQKMMHYIFNNAKRPFYASTKSIHLKKIPNEYYTNFIKIQFQNAKFSIDDEAVELILEITHTHTFYTQILCHELIIYNKKKITTEIVLKVLAKILAVNEGTFYQYRNLLTPIQWQLLKAIAIEEKVFHIYSQEFIKKHNLGNTASVKRSLESLIEKEMVYSTIDVETPFYEVYDKFLMKWLQ